MPKNIVDSHCHLNMVKKYNDLSKVIERAKQNRVTAMLNISIDLESAHEVIKQTELSDNIWASVGTHPCHTSQSILNEKSYKKELLELTQHPKVIAIGETGLDYFHTKKEDSEHQKPYFVSQLTVAKQTKLPIIIHCRNAKTDVVKILKEQSAEQCGGVMHCFAEDWVTAKAALDLGFYISFSGILTYKKSNCLREVAKKIPNDRLLVETDSPYLSPEPVRSKKNEPHNVRYTLDCLASVKSKSIQEMAKITSQNFEKCFKVKLST